MMSPAGASRAVVPVLPGWPPEEFCPAAPAAAATGAGKASLPAADRADVPDALDAELELPEHPARNIPPPRMALPIARAATAWYLVCPARAPRRVRPRVFSMPL
jgi:hypothetical protein